MNNLGFEERWERLKELDDGKARLIEDLIAEVNKLSDKYRDTESDLHLAQETNSMLHKSKREVMIDLKQKQKEMDCNPFVLVLIDGDGMNFLDDLIKSGESGGRDAVQRLRDSVMEHIRSNVPDLDHEFHTIIRVYANMRGLSKTYCDAGILDGRENLDQFVRGFNMGHTFCNFIDAGNGKECSDDKMREDCKFHVSMPHCKHIIFGGSADNGYARLLGPFASDETINKRITMLEGPPFAPELSRLVHKFTRTSFTNVFRNTKIQGQRASFTTNTPEPATKKPMWAAAKVIPGPKLPTWATTATLPNPLPERIPAPSPPAEQAQTYSIVPQNALGQRVDTPLKGYDPSAVDTRKLKARKLCNNFHLGHQCYNGKLCQHEHGKLNAQELLALRHIARGNPCMNGVYCEDPDCFSGHRCTHAHRYGVECRFPADMHDVDLRIANR